MLSPVTKNINSHVVTFIPMRATSAAKLDMKVASLVLPVLKALGLDGNKLADLKAEVDLNAVLGAVGEALGMLSDARLDGILLDSLRGCTVVAPGQAPVEVASIDDLDKLFQGELETLYKAVFESWRYNKLSPFTLAARFGLKMGGTDTSEPTEPTPKGPGLKLAR